MGDETTGPHHTGPIRRVPAATRAVGTDRYVCPVGWSSEVYELSGAAAAVWSVLDDTTELAQVAQRCAVQIDDEFLTSAITLLTEAGLVADDIGVRRS